MGGVRTISYDDRRELVEAIEAWLERHGAKRSHISIVLGVTTAAISRLQRKDFWATPKNCAIFREFIETHPNGFTEAEREKMANYWLLRNAKPRAERLNRHYVCTFDTPSQAEINRRRDEAAARREAHVRACLEAERERYGLARPLGRALERMPV
jgi:hypothetical protein